MIEEEIGRLLREKGWSIAIAESCSGGLISHRLTNVAGASNYFERAIVAYSNKAKTEVLGVSSEIIQRHGAVSEETALAMAEGVRNGSKVDIGLAVTGIAGPSGGTEEKPVGTVFIALSSSEGDMICKRFSFRGNRLEIKDQSSQKALEILLNFLKKEG